MALDFGSNFDYPDAPAPAPAPAPPTVSSPFDVTSFTPEPQCPDGSKPGPDGCPSGGGPSPVGGGPETCAAQGKVWRSDTNRCEYPDERSKAGQDTCTGAMPTCPPGQDVWCDFDDAQFKCARSSWSNDELCGRQNRIRRDQGKPELPCSQLGFGGGPGGGGGGGKGGGFGPSPDTLEFDKLLRQYIEDALKSPSRYTPEALQAIYGQIARQASGQITRGQRDVRSEAARRNMSRAGSVGAALRGVRDTAEQQRGSAMVGVQTAKINADYQDKMGALDRAQRYLDSVRDNEYRYMLMGEQRRQFDANLALAYANLAQQRAMLQMQLQSAWDMLRANQGFWLLQQGA